MNPQSLLEQFLGPNAAGNIGSAIQDQKSKLAGAGVGGVAGGLAVGGLLGLLLGNKKARKKAGKLAGGVIGYGGAAALGALAYRAYRNYQGEHQAPQVSGRVEAMAPDLPKVASASAADAAAFDPAASPAKDGKPFELALVLAMIAAANADGHIDASEQKSIFDQVGNLPLDAEAKAFVFDALAKPPSLQAVADFAEGPAQASELYLVSRLAIDPDHPMETAYLEALASRLGLPAPLVAEIESQVQQVSK
jgi:uncharacterized membrane protein YebE (DUF533 family)